MAVQPKAGEMLVGSYLKMVKECEIVAYGQHSPIEGEQMEVDVIGIQPQGEEGVIACEVATHIRGLGYGNAETNRDRIESKFRNAETYVNQAFDASLSHQFQFWSPRVPNSSAVKLQALAETFEERTGHGFELVMNEDYTQKIESLRDVAGSTTAQRNELAFRFLQILEQLKE